VELKKERNRGATNSEPLVQTKSTEIMSARILSKFWAVPLLKHYYVLHVVVKGRKKKKDSNEGVGLYNLSGLLSPGTIDRS
jgi:hypothetical protein